MRHPEDELAELESASLKRNLRPVDSPQLPHFKVNGETLLNFASNDYLGLANHPSIKAAYQEALEQWGAGSGSSRLICGSLPPHRELETFLAEAKGTSAALVFSNGYATSVGTLSALLQKGDTVILDKLSHASLIDGARLSRATIRVFPHNDLTKLEKLLQSTTEKAPPHSRTIIVTESVFSMDGDISPLAEIIALKQKYGVLLLVDEAHGLGVYGKNGMGLSEHLDCSSDIDFHMGTLGKSAGVAGGYIACSQPYRELLANRARSFIYSTAPPPAQSAAALAALKLIHSDEGTQLREKLWANIRYFSELTQSPLASSAIIPWHIGDSASALALSNKLQHEYSILAPAVRYPTVPRNTARLRITLTAAHSNDDIKQLYHSLAAS
ncbi:8-amino-7-oxononanoate synthase [Rubritalea spongiae]|uniref:8-amino-7-oxononanoate synthase n=1 Tax=Rubritalea spongiae TaxID=430797 RepID=A0ABW5E3E2_9BACT